MFSVEKRGRDLFAAVQRLDLEGIVAKRKADPYAPGVTWYKGKSGTYKKAIIAQPLGSFGLMQGSGSLMSTLPAGNLRELAQTIYADALAAADEIERRTPGHE